MWHNFTQILLFAAAVVKIENSVASQIHDVTFVPDVKLITKSFDIVEDLTLSSTLSPTQSSLTSDIYLVGSVLQVS